MTQQAGAVADRVSRAVHHVRQSLLKRTGIVNTTAWQRRNWEKELAVEAARPWDVLGYSWGDPEATQDQFGNYRRVLDLLRGGLTRESCVVEIGSYGGKWTQFMLGARSVICVDLFERSAEVLRQRFGARENLRFYKTNGNELRWISSSSADVVFSMDTLVRVPARSIRKYLVEAHRILAPGGRTILHLPCEEVEMSRRRGFTPLSKAWVTRTASEAGFRTYQIDAETLKHGILFLARKDGG